MADDDQENPLTPATKTHLRQTITIDEALSTELRNHQKGFRNRTVCCGITTAIVLIIAVVMLILGVTVLHIKNPKINMNSVKIIGLDRVNSPGQLGGNASVTVVADVSVKNTNVAAFKFEKSNSSLLYHDTVVGVADIPGGIAKARRTMRLNVTFEVTVAEIVGNEQFVSDFAATILPVESYTKINGRVKILNFIKRKVTVTMNCTIAVNVTSQEIVNQGCKKHVSI